MDAPLQPGLYIVATPIGNLGDVTLRACEVLRGVSAVACEDTRVTGKLLKHLGIKQRLIRYDDHASDETRDYLLSLAAQGPVALVSDAGTPLISDPGYQLVRAARAAGIAVTSLPGASAAITALTLSGLPSDRFLFVGFLPAKAKARGEILAELSGLRATLVFYETGPRLVDMLAAVDEVLPSRELAVARELTKLYEECRSGSAAELIAHYAAHPPKGEIVVLVGPPGAAVAVDFDIDALLRAELASAKASQAAAKIAKLTGVDRKLLFSPGVGMKMSSRAEREAKGRRGEWLAAWYLRLTGWRILAARMKTPRGEVDLVARRGRLVAFVEVKWRASDRELELAIDEYRLRRVAAAAEVLATRYVRSGNDMRIDVLLLAPGRFPRHLKNVWMP